MSLSEPPLREIDLTPSVVLRVWWLYAWRTFLGTFVVAFVLGFIWAFAAKLLGGSPKVIEVGGTALGVVAGLAWSIIGVYMALTKTYREFRIALVATQPIRADP